MALDLMISRANVDLAVRYLDQCRVEGKPATLVGAFWYIDVHNKLVPEAEEINEALKEREDVFVQRAGDVVAFGYTGSEREITAEDMRAADRQYRKEFAAAYAKLRAK
jgi:hypothetical protein